MLKNYLLIVLMSIFLASCGGGGGSTAAAAAADNSLTVSPIDEQATLKNVATTVALFATDSSYTQAISFTATSSSLSVVATIVDSTLTLTPANGFTGTPTITVKAFDGTLYSAAQTFTFTVCDSACAPVLSSIPDATIGTLINTAASLTLNGTDANSDSLTYSATSSTTDVVPSISGTTLTLTPATGWTGTATITAKVSDAALDSTVKTFDFTVCETACLPTLASISTQATTEDNAKAVTLVGADPASDALTYTATSSTTNVTTTISGSTLTLNPKLNFFGSATITAKATDGDGLSATRTFTLNTSAVNDAPVLSSVSNQTTNEDTAKTVNLSATDIEESSLTYTATSSNSSNVAASISGSTLTLTPASNFNGTATITATANDGAADSATQSFTITVSAVNDAPVVGTVADTSTDEDTAKSVTLSETDVDTSDSHTFIATSSTANVVPSVSGTTLTMTPAANWSGTATITIKTNDGTVDSATKTFVLTVNAVNDAPVLTSIANQVTLKNTAKTVTLAGTDVEGSSLTFPVPTSSASQITPSVSGTTLTLTPDNNWTGTSTITQKTNDGALDSATKTFTITVNNTNTAPVVASVSAQSTNEDTAKAVTLSGTDSDDDSLTYSATSAESEVTPSVSGTTLTLTPDANWNGTSVITFKANDGIANSPTKTFTLTVNAINDAPVLASISAQATAKNSAKTVTLSGSDTEGSSMTYSATTSASQITIGISGTTLTLTPDNNWTGTSTITAKANDGALDSAAKTFVLTVGNTAPTLASISAQATNQSVKKTLTISAADANSDSLSYAITSSPSSKVSGSVSGSTLTLTPLASYNGTAAVTVTVNDGTDTAARTFNLVVTANDPLYQYQWHLDNTGQTAFASNAGTSTQDINVDGAITTGYDGDGITIAVVDSGLELAHEDLSPNIVSGGSWDYAGNDNDPTNSSSTGDHGTSVGGLICAAGWNGKGGRGVSPACSLKGFNILSQYTTANSVASHGGASYAQDVDIFNQSYGYTGLYGEIQTNATEEAQMLSAVTNLRSGKGAIMVKSAGNSYDKVKFGVNYYFCDTLYGFDTGLTCQNSTSQPPNNWPYNIVVGALSAQGIKESYSTTGSNLWISAPGGNGGTAHPGMVTADQSGCSQGYVRSGFVKSGGNNAFNNQGNHSENSSCNYTSQFNGTSSAAPVTAGAIGLIIEANPNLTWRDVKHILATTSDQVDASKANVTLTVNGSSYVAIPAWTTNDADHKFHDWYGFGRINVGDAISAALSYSAGSLGTLAITNYSSNTSGTISKTIPSNNVSGVTDTIAVSETEIIEAVKIQVSATHGFTGELAIELVSPAGTKSVLKTPYDFFLGTDNLANMELTSNAFYGEETDGNWTIKVIDAGNYTGGTGSLTKWSISFYQH